MSCEHTQRCSGHCCRRFYLPFEPEQLQEMARTGKHPHNPDEIRFVADMVIPIEAAKDAKAGVDGGPPPETGWYYTCRHHDTASGNCTVYEQRPRVCRDYPFYGAGFRNRCRYKECTWEEARNPTIPVSHLLPTRKLTLNRALDSAVPDDNAKAEMASE